LRTHPYGFIFRSERSGSKHGTAETRQNSPPIHHNLPIRLGPILIQGGLAGQAALPSISAAAKTPTFIDCAVSNHIGVA
jgi:hypothetical protein